MTDLKFTSPSGETTIKVEGTGRLGTVAPKTQLHIKMDEPVKYETPMTKSEEEIEKVKAQIKVLQKKLDFLEELEKTKSPVEEAFKDWMGVYPPTNPSVDNIFDIRWRAFQMGYNAAYEEKISEEQEEQVSDDFMDKMIAELKGQTLTDLIYDWWEDVFTYNSEWDTETSIDDLVTRIDEWLPKEQSAAGSQNAYVECSVEGFNDAIKKIKGKLR